MKNSIIQPVIYYEKFLLNISTYLLRLAAVRSAFIQTRIMTASDRRFCSTTASSEIQPAIVNLHSIYTNVLIPYQGFRLAYAAVAVYLKSQRPVILEIIILNKLVKYCGGAGI